MSKSFRKHRRGRFAAYLRNVQAIPSSPDPDEAGGTRAVLRPRMSTPA
jgi:hypothetical protein